MTPPPMTTTRARCGRARGVVRYDGPGPVDGEVGVVGCAGVEATLLTPRTYPDAGYPLDPAPRPRAAPAREALVERRQHADIRAHTVCVLPPLDGGVQGCG